MAAVPRPAVSESLLRALVFLRDGLTTDSTGRILPEVRRAAEVHRNTPATLTIHQAHGEARIMATSFYHVRAGAGLIDSPHDRAR